MTSTPVNLALSFHDYNRGKAWDYYNLDERQPGLLFLKMSVYPRETNFSAARFGNDLYVARTFERLPDPRPDDVMVVSQKSADF